MENNIKRLTIELPKKDHDTIKIEAIKNGDSLKKWVIDAIAYRLANEGKLN